MTNKEWLDYLAHNAPDELAAWFDAEHVENKERALDGDTAAQDGDSREQLEADIKKYRWEHSETSGRVTEWLDRQAAITAEETSDAWEEYRDATHREIAELTAERDKLQEQLHIGWEYECKFQAERDELQAKVDELTAERDEMKGQMFTLKSECDDLENERDNLKEHSRTIEYRCKKAETDCEIYRKKFDKCLDYADAIHALMDDEGMA